MSVAERVGVKVPVWDPVVGVKVGPDPVGVNVTVGVNVRVTPGPCDWVAVGVKLFVRVTSCRVTVWLGHSVAVRLDVDVREPRVPLVADSVGEGDPVGVSVYSGGRDPVLVKRAVHEGEPLSVWGGVSHRERVGVADGVWLRVRVGLRTPEWLRDSVGVSVGSVMVQVSVQLGVGVRDSVLVALGGRVNGFVRVPVVSGDPLKVSEGLPECSWVSVGVTVLVPPSLPDRVHESVTVGRVQVGSNVLVCENVRVGFGVSDGDKLPLGVGRSVPLGVGRNEGLWLCVPLRERVGTCVPDAVLVAIGPSDWVGVGEKDGETSPLALHEWVEAVSVPTRDTVRVLDWSPVALHVQWRDGDHDGDGVGGVQEGLREWEWVTATSVTVGVSVTVGPLRVSLTTGVLVAVPLRVRVTLGGLGVSVQLRVGEPVRLPDGWVGVLLGVPLGALSVRLPTSENEGVL
mmetsp:Transcript_100227/g.173154  ORF Transcript_100227/g.173154 Transcript_100227/m.173154 type:complete len:457 (-) Transcript_100227:793-2163(-)